MRSSLLTARVTRNAYCMYALLGISPFNRANGRRRDPLSKPGKPCYRQGFARSICGLNPTSGQATDLHFLTHRQTGHQVHLGGEGRFAHTGSATAGTDWSAKHRFEKAAPTPAKFGSGWPEQVLRMLSFPNPNKNHVPQRDKTRNEKSATRRPRF